MLIKRMSPFSGKERSMNIDITHEQLDEWEAGELIQNVMPNISASEREFIISGSTAEEFEAMFKDVE